MKIFFPVLLLLFCLSSLCAESQNKYWVFFTDKKDVLFDPSAYFTPEAIEKKKRAGIKTDDETDKPVKQEYIDKIAMYCDSMSYASRWFNCIAVYSDDNRVQSIKEYAFVRDVQLMNELIPHVSEIDDFENNEGLLKLAKGQIQRMQGEKFAANGITGKGIRIAIIDGGFTGIAEDSEQREKYFKDVKIVATYDFIGKSENVFRKNQHGKTVLGCIAGKADSLNLGLAPEAEFLLARTAKNFSEGTKDEEYWLAAVEWCDKNGAQIINTSLGYDVNHYFQKDMDGKTSLISRSANLAAKKGILVVVSAGNEGQNYWKKICTPADADSVLTVGALNPFSGIQASWSSYGPSADFRMKPEVCAYGNVAGIYNTGIAEMMGTSFSSPLVAGFAACVMQLHPDWDCMKVKAEIMRSADLFPYFDYVHGHGVPQAGYFFNEQKNNPETFIIKSDSLASEISIIINDDHYSYNVPFIPNYHFIKDIQGEIPEEPVIPSLHIFDLDMSQYASTLYLDMPDYLFYHIENTKGYLDNYYVLAIENKNVITINLSNYEAGTKFRFFYKNCIKTYEVK